LIKKTALIIAFLLVLPCALSYISVEIFPATGEEIITLYPEEKAQFRAVIENLGKEKVSGLDISAYVDDGLFIIDGMEKTQSKSWHFEEIKAGHKNEVLFFVKPAEGEARPETERKKITVYYGVEKTVNYTGTYLEISPSPLYVEASIEKSTMNPEEENSVIVTVQNRGNAPLENIEGKIIPASSVQFTGESTFFQDKLGPPVGTLPGAEVGNKRFAFTIKEGTEGETPIIVRIQFEDAKGKHTVERDLSFAVQDKTLVFYMIIFVILLLIILALISRRGRQVLIPKKENVREKPAVQE